MTEEEMRNDPKYKEITKKLDSYLIYNNVPGYLNCCMDSLKECVQQKIDGDPEREEVTRLAINDNMSYFGATDKEEHSEFFKKMIDLIAQKRVACIYDMIWSMEIHFDPSAVPLYLSITAGCTNAKDFKNI